MVTYAPVRPSISVAGVGVVSPFGTTHDAFVERAALRTDRDRPDDRLRHRSTAAPRSRSRRSTFEPTQWVTPMKLRRLDRTGVYAVALTRLAFEDGRAHRQPGRRRSRRRGARHLDRRRTIDRTVSRVVLQRRPLGGAGAAVREHRGERRRQPGRHGVQAARTKRHRQPQGSVRAWPRSSPPSICCAPAAPPSLIAGGVDAVYESFFKAYDRFRRHVGRTGALVPHLRRSTSTAPVSCWVKAASGCGCGPETRTEVAHGEILGVAARGRRSG